MQYSNQKISRTRTVRCIQNPLPGTLLGLVFLFTGLLAQAQLPSKATAPPNKPSSFSEHSDTKPAVKPHATIHVSSEDSADAILADTLNRIDEEADEHFHPGEYNHTINLYQIVIQGDPHNVDAYSNSAFLLWSTDRNTQAIAELKKGLEANPNNYYMYDELGTHYWIHLKDAAGAIPYLEKAVKFECPFTTYHNLAFCYQKLGQWDKAVKIWETAARYTKDPVAPIKLKQAQAQLAKMHGDVH